MFFLIAQIGTTDLILEQARMNVKAGFIASINFVGSYQLLTAEHLSYLAENTFKYLIICPSKSSEWRALEAM